MSPKYLIIPEFAKSDIKLLCQLPSDKIVILGRVLSDKSSVTSDQRIYQLIADRMGLGYEQSIGLLSAVKNLRRQRERYDLTADQLLDDLLELLADEDPLSDDQRTALKGLLQKSEEDHFVEKVGSLKHALLPHLVDVATIVDIRPVFRRDREQVDGLLLVAYMELTTHDHATDDFKHVRVRLSRADMKTLREKLEDAELKLTRLEETFKEHDLYE